MRRLLFAAVAASTLLLAGCSGASATTVTTASSSPSADSLTGDLTVYAAASLKKAFDEVSVEFVKENPGVTVKPIVYDGSSTLATQIIGGAKPDVFASADQANMTKVTAAKLAETPVVFATNTLVIAVPKANPGGVKTLADLANTRLKVVLCAPGVPCGTASKTLLGNQNVTVTPASSEQNVTAVLTKVAAGEADAGLVYATDVIGNADVVSIVPAGAADVVNTYPVVALTGASNSAAAAAFVAFVTGEKGQTILANLGFGAP